MDFRFNEAQVLFAREVEWFNRYRLPIRIVACKSRRAGISTVVQAYMFHDTINSPGTHTMIVANQTTPSENILKMANTFRRSMPEDIAGIPIRPVLPRSYRNNPPKDRLEFPDLGSDYVIASARSIDRYLGHGIQNIHATEVAYYEDGYGLFRAIGSTLVKVAHSMCVLESTPNGMTGKGQFFYEQVIRADQNSRDDTKEPEAYRLLFIPWHVMGISFARPFQDEAARISFRQTLSAIERDIMRLYPHVTLEQLAWRRAVLRRPEFNGDDEIFDQEFPSDLETAFLSKGATVFSRKTIKRLRQYRREPEWVGDIYWGKSDKDNEHEGIGDIIRRPVYLTMGEAQARGFASHVNEGTYNNLRVYQWPRKDDRIFICGDVSWGDPGSSDGDYSVLQIGRLGDAFEQDELLMTWRGRCNPTLFAEIASALGWAIWAKVKDDVVAPEVCIEWNGPGVSANTHLDRFKLYPHIYLYVALSTKGQKKTTHLGWESNSKTKPQMVSWTQRHVEDDRIDIPDRTTVLEMAAYRKFDNYGDEGSYSGEAGMHDDTVTALQILVVRLRYAASSGEDASVEYVIEAGDDEEAEEGNEWDPHAESDDPAEDLDDDEDPDEYLFYHDDDD